MGINKCFSFKHGYLNLAPLKVSVETDRMELATATDPKNSELKKFLRSPSTNSSSLSLPIASFNPKLEVILPVSVVAGLMVIERSLHDRLGVGLDYCQSIFQRTIVPELWRMLERLSYRNIDGHLVEPLEDETKLNISPPVRVMRL